MTTTPYIAPALATLWAETKARFPKRDSASDGWLGDARHQAESFSDHNPDPNSLPPGCVRALDIDSGPDGDPVRDIVADVLSATIGDPRVWYVISQGRIYSRTHGWAALVYTGSDPHISHVHVSLQGHNGITEQTAHDLAFDTSPWFGTGPKPPTLPTIRLHNVVDAARHPFKSVHPRAVKFVQEALNARGHRTTVDGIYGPATRTSVQAFQRAIGFTGGDADGILGPTSGARLGANRYRLAP